MNTNTTPTNAQITSVNNRPLTPSNSFTPFQPDETFKHFKTTNRFSSSTRSGYAIIRKGDHIQALNFSVGGKWNTGKVKARDGKVHYYIQMNDGQVWRRHTGTKY